MARYIPGVNIQWPWSQMLLSGKKTVETRSYALPEKYLGVELAVIETPGPRGKGAGIDKARVVGTIVFSKSFQYQSKERWESDQRRHLVDPEDTQFAWGKRRSVWGWEVNSFKKFKSTKPAPKKRGIVFATSCEI